MKSFKVLVLAASLAALPGSAMAWYYKPRLDPPMPREGEPVSVVIRAGFCHGFVYSQTRPTVEHNGQAIELIIMGIEETDVHCIFPYEGFDYVYELGRFERGKYEVTVRMEHAGDSERDYLMLGTVAMTVLKRGTLHSIPVGGGIALACAIVLVGGLAAWRGRRG